MSIAVNTLSLPDNRNHYPSYIIRNSEKWMTKLESPLQSPTKATILSAKPLSNNFMNS